ncbi:alpha/beta fold hydrolase [Type-D symbiont of Plautia stali]|uniref:alpha/beta fold hydrolase n=1 Tax=Type-D symbiont of Plautia stali TaxID=1560356 RepID=UPI00073F61F4|nr:alpha/beta hydrolase [Type-D symbiont of Plautia stali]
MSNVTDCGASPFIDGFMLKDVKLPNGVTLRVAMGGEGTPLLMLHGHPQNHLAWRKIAPQLAEKYQVILPDLRGYGDSDKPVSDEQHLTYAKRSMAEDISQLIDALELERVAFVGHDRGGRVGHRLALDHPEKLACCTFVDIAPTATMYAQTDKAFATRYFWWFFLIQPYPLPETMIGHDPAFFLKKHIEGQLKTPDATSEEIFHDYLRCYQQPEMIHAVCEDYRAAATIDLEHDAQDSDKRIACPLQLLWGEKGTVGQLYDVVATWQDKARDVQGSALPCGHSPQEEVPALFLNQLQGFLNSVL